MTPASAIPAADQGLPLPTPTEHPADLLDTAAAVIAYLSETAACCAADTMESEGLTSQACTGLALILQGVETTLNQAAKAL